ncbi:antitoxin VapB family protein [Candidatus Woesearchaeota archaeon]|nr:antitoxin VapB family protein [Candidatus Woesearchaeota archaeon]
MAVKTITITEDAYTLLATLKTAGESFSDVVCRIAGKSSLSKLSGILSNKEANELETSIKKIRKNIDARIKRIADELK